MGVLDKVTGNISGVGGAVSTAGSAALGIAGNTIGGILGEDLAGQLFENYVPLERYTEYQRLYNWEVVFPFMMGNVPGPIISKYCKAVAFGDYRFDDSDIVRIQKGPKSLFVPGTLSINTVTMEFIVPFPNLVQGYFDQWKKLIVDDSGYYSEQSWYKKTIYVRTYTTQGITSGTIKMIGAFPKNYYEYQLSYKAEDVVRYSIVFCIDDIQFTGFDLMSSIPRVLKSVF